MEHIKPQGSGHVTDPAHGHEKTDINIKAVLVFGALLLFSGFAVHGILWAVYRGLDKYEQSRIEAPNPMVPQETIARHAKNANTMEPATQMAESSEEVNRRIVATFPEPRLQIDDVHDMNALRQSNDKQLNGYEWIDQNSGSVRIPISRAMDVIAERGLPDVPAPPPAKANIGVGQDASSKVAGAKAKKNTQ